MPMIEYQETPQEAAKWLQLCLITEDNEPHAYLPLAWAIRNRVEWPRNAQFLHPEIPESYRSVILRAQQFSEFNDLTAAERLKPWEQVAELVLRYRPGMFERLMSGQDDLCVQALHAATNAINYLRLFAPFSNRVLYFYAPESMAPPGSQPTWWPRAVWNTIELPGLTRWKFGEVK